MKKQPAEAFAVDDSSLTEEDPRVLAALKEYQAALDAGTPFDRHKFLDRYPDVAGELAEALDALHWVHAAAATVKPLAVDLLAAGQKIGAYRAQAEIGRGGMGVVYRGHDPDLDRWLAIKVLLDEHKDNVVLRRRFLDEARVMGQLQHPGVAPIHELGQLEDGRPFFSMKQIQGRMLAELLRSQESGIRSQESGVRNQESGSDASPLTPHHAPTDLPRRLDIFEQVCQTVAYAHAQGIIHRDLKPHNVMVGAFGEVQVMDWGLAKHIRTGSETQNPQLETETAEFATSALGLPLLDSAPAAETTAGTVLGTLAYMAPEQARGEVDRLDERCDVFGLGAILCEILTGQAPFAGCTKMDSHLRATKGELGETFANLDRCGADGDLIQLTRHCLAPKKEDRPDHAGEVARALASYRRSVQARLRQAEIDRAAAVAKADEERRRREAEQAKAREERRRRRVQLALATCVVALVAGAGAAGLWYVQDSADRALERAGQEAVKKSRRAEAAQQAAESLKRARAWMSAGNIALARQELAEAKGRIGNERAALQGLAAEIDALDAALAGFQRYFGLVEQAHDAETRLTPERALLETGGTKRPPGAWSNNAWDPAKSVPFRLKALACYHVMERDDWLAELEGGLGHASLVQQVRRSLYEELLWLADDMRTRGRDHRSGIKLSTAERARQGLAYLQKAVQVWQPTSALYHLRAAFQKALGKHEAAHADVALARSTPLTMAVDHYLLGQAALRARNKAAAIKQFEAALRREPHHYIALLQLGVGLSLLGEQERDFATAVVAFTGCILKRPEHAAAWNNRGVAYKKLHKYDQAIEDYTKAIELKPDYSEAWNNRGAAYCDLCQYDKALAEHSKAIALMSNNAEAWYNRGFVYHRLRQYDKALADYAKAVELKPDWAAAWHDRGITYQNMGQFDKAIPDYSKAIELKADHVDAWYYRGNAYRNLRQFEKALADYSKALELKPDYAEVWTNRGVTYSQLCQYDHAIADYSKAIEAKADLPEAWNNRGNAHSNLQQYDQAIADYSKAIELKPDYVEAWGGRGNAYYWLRQYDKAVADHSKVIKLKPDLALGWNNRATAYAALRQYDRAIADHSKAIELEADNAAAWYNRGNAHANLRQYDHALADYSKAIELKPDYAKAWRNRGYAHGELRQYDKAIADYSKAIELAPRERDAHNNLARLLATCPDPKWRDPERAVSLAQKAIELGVGPNGWATLGMAHYRAGNWQASAEATQKAIVLNKGGTTALHCFFLAMAQQRLGKTEQARKTFDQAAQWMEKNQPNTEELRRFRAEAEDVLRIKKK
jgi:tetratricopeptide (TPR) repeat protein/serine/threonine protein kinase